MEWDGPIRNQTDKPFDKLRAFDSDIEWPAMSAGRKAGVEWLPDMGSNHDWVSQSHLCYHYTIGQ